MDSEGIAYPKRALEEFTAAYQSKRPEELAGTILIGRGGRPNGQGPHIQLHVVVANGQVVDAAFKTYGCPAAIACSNAICDLIKGKSLISLRAISERDLQNRVGQLPRSKAHCYALAIHALDDVIRQLESSLKSPATNVIPGESDRSC